MNKTELIAAVAQKANLTQKDAASALNATLTVITDTLASGDKVQIVGFGSFEAKDRAERMGRNPRTNETFTVPASRSPVFKAGKKLKDKVQ